MDYFRGQHSFLTLQVEIATAKSLYFYIAGAGKHIFQDVKMVRLPLLALHAGTTGSSTASFQLPTVYTRI